MTPPEAAITPEGKTSPGAFFRGNRRLLVFAGVLSYHGIKNKKGGAVPWRARKC